jgi:2-polyprenyl-3-methyl-5-hydroxy-6-metoxy-1,4-benzoquinol methylase
MDSRNASLAMPSNQENISHWSAIPPAQLAALDPEGDFAKRHLLNPTVFNMIGDVAGRRILDAGAGQGYFSRLLARLGAVVTSVDPADPLIAHSRRLQEQDPLDVNYVLADLTEITFEPVFDVVIANMVFLSIHDWTRALDTCADALRSGGMLVFSVDHPCFEIAEWRPSPTDPQVIVRDYLTERPLARPVATDFHRTVSTYLNAVVAAGLVVSEIAEPGLGAADAAEPGAPASAELMTKVSNFLVVKAGKPA